MADAHQEQLHFLQAPEAELDAGYGRELQKLVWNQSGQSEPQALALLQGADLQAEIDCLALCGGSSLDIERKHFVDKRAEKRKVCSLSKASRDSIVQRWRTRDLQRRMSSNMSPKQRKRLVRKAKFTNLSSLAVRKKPDILLNKGGKGRLWWQRENRASSSGSSVPTIPSTDSVQDYIARQRGTLEAELAQLRQQAERAIAAEKASFADSCIPESSGKWMQWLSVEENRRLYDDHSRAVRGGVRKKMNKRLVVEATKDAVARLSPAETQLASQPLPTWARGVAAGCLLNPNSPFKGISASLV